jgi:hypothetical protein
MFSMFSPADALGGRNGAMHASMLVGWFFGTFALLVAAALILLMTSGKTTRAWRDRSLTWRRCGGAAKPCPPLPTRFSASDSRPHRTA